MYETEEQQLEALKKWWEANKVSTISGLVLGIALILGTNYWQEYKKEQSEQASALYAQLTKTAQSAKKDDADKIAERLQNDYPKSDYAAYSALVLAKLKVEKGDIATAKTLLEKIASGSNKELSNIAKIRLVRLMLANKEYEQGLKLINEVDPSSNAKFEGNYDELVGDLYVALGRFDQARTSYKKAIDDGYRSPLLQFKIDDLTAPDKLTSTK
ncbi:MAG: tetratricopeptide repeat protein [Methylococcaceae bacterium]